ncbi:diacylglycerol kinase [Alteromonadaceae bacterium BrNp21-10]|nr:diacylglycerol kinase [Alteromonadaceae bacterium BrNp21-10]
MTFDSSNKPVGLKRIYLALHNSLRAYKWLIANESAFRQELVLLVVSLCVIGLWDIALYERLMLLCATLLVLFAEIINTAIEAAIDRISYEIHPLSGLAKDLASAAVLVSLTILGLVWACVFYSNL